MTRLEKVRVKMKELGTQALLVTSQTNRRYLSKFNSSAGIVIITMERAYCIVDFRYIEAAEKSIDREFEVLQQKVSFIEDAAKITRQLGIKSMAYENHSMSVYEYEKYKSCLECELIPFDDKIEVIRQEKDNEELEYIKKAQSITEKAFLNTLPQLKAGMTEKAVASVLMNEMYKNGADGLAFDVIAVSGENSSLPHGVPSHKEIQKGDFLTMDFGAVYNGYASDMTRTVAFDHVTDEMSCVYGTVLKAQLECLKKAEKGMRGDEIDAIARDIISKAGYGEYFQHGLGHCVGLNVHENPRASKVCRDTLKAGNVLTIEPGIYIPKKFGVRIEDMIYFGENGVENLTNIEKELVIIK